MCGIIGFHSGKGIRIDDTSAKQMLGVLSHRGPDAEGIYNEGELFFGHLRLSILDLSQAANQPMHSHCGRYVMVYNGEIYNYREIQQELSRARAGFAPRTTSDSESILEAFAQWGISFVDKLNGMFAIAIWDKHEKKIYLFRDRLGIKPIYYFHHKDIFAFASELKGILALPEIKKKVTINPEAVNKYLHLGYIPHPDSIYREVHKFPAGHYGVFSNNNFELREYWNLPEFTDRSLVTDRHEAIDSLRTLVESSVRYRLISDVPYGTFLSGGIDSSLVSAVAQKINSAPINTFSIGMWDSDFNEAHHARQIASYLGTHHHELMVTEKDALEWIPELISIYDEPYADSSAIPTLLVSKLARQHVAMTLSGDGGDELFMGYGAYKWAQRLASPILSSLKSPIGWALNLGNNRFKRVSHLFGNVPSHQIHSHIFSQEQYLFSRRELNSLLNPAFLREFNLVEKVSENYKYLTPAQNQSLFDLKYYLPDDLLVKVDRASMHFGLETRVPLLDYRIVEWALQLHPDLKIKNGEAKWILKQLLFEYIPSNMFDRPKKGFAIPLQKWLKTDLRPFIMENLSFQNIESTGMLNYAEVNRLLTMFYNKNHEYLYNRIWQLAVLQNWLIRFNRL